MSPRVQHVIISYSSRMFAARGNVGGVSTTGTVIRRVELQ